MYSLLKFCNVIIIIVSENVITLVNIIIIK